MSYRWKATSQQDLISMGELTKGQTGWCWCCFHHDCLHSPLILVGPREHTHRAELSTSSSINFLTTSIGSMEFPTSQYRRKVTQNRLELVFHLLWNFLMHLWSIPPMHSSSLWIETCPANSGQYAVRKPAMLLHNRNGTYILACIRTHG